MARKVKLGNPEVTDENILPLVDDYITHLRINLASHWVQHRNRCNLIRFSNFCAREGIAHPTDVTKANISKFYSFLEGSPDISVKQRTNIEGSLRRFYGWLEDQGYMDDDPTSRKSSHRDPRKGLINRACTEDEIEQLVLTHKKEAFTKNPFYYQRRELVLTLGLVWGLSYPEMSALNVSDMDIRQEVVVITKQNGGVRTLPYYPELKMAFQRYMTHRVKKKTFGGEDPLIVIADGSRMPPNEIYHMMRMLGERAGVKLNSYVMKHTANLAMLEHGMSPESIRKVFSRKTKHSLTDLSKRMDQGGLLEEGQGSLQNFSLLFRNSGELLRERNLPLK